MKKKYKIIESKYDDESAGTQSSESSGGSKYGGESGGGSSSGSKYGGGSSGGSKYGGESGGGSDSDYKSTTAFPIEYRTKSEQIYNIQAYISKACSAYKDILTVGDANYGGTYSSWGTPIDGLYGPRTAAAIKAFTTVEGVGTYDLASPISEDLYNEIINSKVDPSNTKWTTPEAKEAAAQVKTDTRDAEVKREPNHESLQRNYYLNPIKNRNKQLEKLVFERLVKGCR